MAKSSDKARINKIERAIAKEKAKKAKKSEKLKLKKTLESKRKQLASMKKGRY
jgi:hypothetical protein